LVFCKKVEQTRAKEVEYLKIESILVAALSKIKILIEHRTITN